MAAAHIKFDENKNISRNYKRGVQMLNESLVVLNAVLASITQMVDSGGANAADYDLFAAEGGYSSGDYESANHAAQASYNELASLLSKLNANTSVTDVNAAIKQIAAKHGII